MIPLLPPRRSLRAVQRTREAGGRKTIAVALAANALIFVAKLVAGLVSGSSGLLAEAAHSAADTLNEILLARSVRRDRRGPHPAHPVGRGRERFLWAFLAALSFFVLGGGVSILLAVRRFRVPGNLDDTRAAWIVLAVSFAAESVSLAQSVRQAKRQARDYRAPLATYLRRASDPVVRAVVFEDAAALTGLGLAAAGLFLSERLGSTLPDAIASLLIGLLLAATAVGLARPLAELLVGRSLPRRDLERVHELLEETPQIGKVVTLHAFYTGPEEVVVVAKANPAKDVDASDLSRAMDELEERVREEIPVVADVFVDVTRRKAVRRR